LIDAFNIMRGRIANAGLVFVNGDAPLAPAVRAALRANGTSGIQIIGHVPHSQMPMYMRAADVGVSIPSSDGSPSSVWEALACGLPLVLSNLPQVEERVGRSGAVRLVDPHRAEAAAALTEILSQSRLRDRMALAGREWALDNADERDQIERLGRLFAAMTGRLPTGQPPRRHLVR
jgi:glycosyltransferase involved in cell wall biosynthesis